MTEMSADEFRQVIDVDLNAPFIVSKAVIPTMIKNGGGKIINGKLVVRAHDVLHGTVAGSFAFDPRKV